MKKTGTKSRWAGNNPQSNQKIRER